METFAIKFDGIDLLVYAYYHKGTNQFDDPTDIQSHEIRVEGVDIMALLPYEIIKSIEYDVIEKYELA